MRHFPDEAIAVATGFGAGARGGSVAGADAEGVICGRSICWIGADATGTAAGAGGGASPGATLLFAGGVDGGTSVVRSGVNAGAGEGVGARAGMVAGGSAAITAGAAPEAIRSAAIRS